MSQDKTPPRINTRFIITTPFKNRRSGKIEKVPLLNMDGHLDIAHQYGLISLTSKIIREWEVKVPAGQDEYKNDKFDITAWIEVKATAIVRSPDGLGTIITDGYCRANDRDRFVKSPEYLLAVAETRAKKRALYQACNITEEMINPGGTAPTREAVDLPIIDDSDESSPEIPSAVKKNRPDITPGLHLPVSHPKTASHDTEDFAFSG